MRVKGWPPLNLPVGRLGEGEWVQGFRVLGFGVRGEGEELRVKRSKGMVEGMLVIWMKEGKVWIT